MIACAFVACSNDDDPTPTPEAKGEASLVVSVKNGVSGITKAVTQTANEKNIQSLKIVLYNATTKAFLAESSTIAPDDKDDQITNNEIKFTGNR